jgi:hypothetical protein
MIILLEKVRFLPGRGMERGRIAMTPETAKWQREDEEKEEKIRVLIYFRWWVLLEFYSFSLKNR